MGSEIQQRILKRLKEIDKTPQRASLDAGLSKDYLRTLLNRANAAPRGDNLTKISAALKTSPQWLLTGKGDAPGDSTVDAEASKDDKTVRRSQPRPALFDIPVYGLAAGSITGSQKLGDEPIQYVTRPPGLHTVKDAYAMMVTGTSMEPRYFAGEIIFLHPHRPPRTGDHVAIQELVNGDTRTWIKRFEKLTEDHLITTQYNPAIEVKYSRKYIAAVHRVMTPNELMGI